jgi:hypothetical protein
MDKHEKNKFSKNYIINSNLETELIDNERKNGNNYNGSIYIINTNKNLV